MQNSEHGFHLLRLGEVLYLALTTLSFYLLSLSRSGEAYTVWEVLHPAFLPTIFAAASILVMILLTSEKTEYKLIYVIALSIVLHSFFSVVFPAGDLSGQQSILGRVRLVFDNTVLHGLTGWPNRNIQVFIYELFTGANLQAALSVIFARMLSIDIFYVHLFFIPILWGTFTPVAAFLVTRAIGGSEKASVLSGLLISAFPYATYFGAISVPNSLGFIFFFFSLCFMLRYLSSNESRNAYLMLVFSFFSFLAHYLTGIMSFSLLLLALTIRTYKNEEKSAPTNARILLIISFLISLSLLPLSFIYLRVLGTSSAPAFTLDNISELPLQEIVSLALLGELTYSYNIQIVFLNIVGPLAGFLCMLYFLLYPKSKIDSRFRTQIYFLFAGFLIMLIDFSVLRLFMEGLPINVERIWVLRDFIAVPFVGLGAYAVVTFLKGVSKQKPNVMGTANPERPFKSQRFRFFSLLLAFNVLVSVLLGGWITFSLSAAYPQVAPLQITSYELEAARYIDKATPEKYVVISDIWAIYTGQMIVGENNPRAYYFGVSDRIGHELFVNMSRDPSPQWMLFAMNQTDTKVAYFIISEPRLGTDEFNRIIMRVQDPLQLFYKSENGKLYVYSYSGLNQT